MASKNHVVFPNIFIGGVFKAGTTSLFTYMSKHPDIGVSSEKELGYFIPLQFGRDPLPIEEYTKYFKHLAFGSHKYVLEASPGYLYGGEKIAKYMKNLLGNYKIIFILRNPKERLVSFYKYLKTGYIYAYADRLSMEQKDFINNMRFDNYQLESLNYMKSCIQDESREYVLSGIKYSLYADYLQEWFNTLDREEVRVFSFEDIKANPQLVLYQICQWLQIPENVYVNYKFEVQNKTINFKYIVLHKLATYLNRKFEFLLRKNPQFKSFVKQCYYFINKTDVDDEDFLLWPEVEELFNKDWKACQQWIESTS